MKNIMLIFKNSVLRNILMIVISIAAAALMVNVFSAVSKDGSVSEDNTVLSGFDADTMKIGLMDGDKSPLSENMKSYLTETLCMKIFEKNDYDSLADLLIDRDISAIIEVPQGFFENAAAGTVDAPEITTLDDYENAAFINAYLEAYMQGVKVLSDCAAGDKNTFEKMLSADADKGTDNDKFRRNGLYFLYDNQRQKFGYVQQNALFLAEACRIRHRRKSFRHYLLYCYERRVYAYRV